MTKKELKAIAEEIGLEHFSSAAGFLQAVYERIKGRHPKFSYIQFSEALGLSRSNVALLLCHRKRIISLKSGEKIVAALGLTKFRRRYFLQMVRCQLKTDESVSGEELAKMAEMRLSMMDDETSQNQLAFFQNWYHAAILEVLRLDDAQDDPKWLSDHIQPHVSVGKVAKALALLVDLNYLHRDPDKGRLMPSGIGVSTGNEAPELAVSQYHQQMLALSNQALNEIDAQLRDISALTLSIPKEKIMEVKNDLAELRQRLIAAASSDVESGDSRFDQVIQINIQMFPLIKGGGN